MHSIGRSRISERKGLPARGRPSVQGARLLDDPAYQGEPNLTSRAPTLVPEWEGEDGKIQFRRAPRIDRDRKGHVLPCPLDLNMVYNIRKSGLVPQPDAERHRHMVANLKVQGFPDVRSWWRMKRGLMNESEDGRDPYLPMSTAQQVQI